MGQQQLLLIILGVIIVGIAIAVGLSLFSAQSIQSNKDAIINDLNNLAAYAYQYKIRPTSMAGGGNSYANITMPAALASNANATYAFSSAGATVTITGTSIPNTPLNVVAVVDANGNCVTTPGTGW